MVLLGVKPLSQNAKSIYILTQVRVNFSEEVSFSPNVAQRNNLGNELM